MRKRIEQVDIVKGICMFFVAFGHSLPGAGELVSGSLLFYMHKAIHSSILPLFFFLAGLVAVKCLDEVSAQDKLNGLKNRAVRMLVPYFSWALLFIPLRVVFSGFTRFDYDFTKLYTILLGNNPCGQLWFLYVLFLFSSTAVLFATRRNIKFLLPVSFAVTLASCFVTLFYDGINWSNTIFLVFFYYLGLFFSTDPEKIFSYVKFVPFIIAVVIYGVMLFAVPWSPGNSFKEVVFRLIISGAGIYCALYVCNAINSLMGKTKLAKLLSEIGRYSMDVYIFHSPIGIVLRIVLLSLLDVDRWIYMLIYVVVGVFGSYFISKYIVRKIPFFSFLLLGMGKKKKVSQN